MKEIISKFGECKIDKIPIHDKYGEYYCLVLIIPLVDISSNN